MKREYIVYGVLCLSNYGGVEVVTHDEWRDNFEEILARFNFGTPDRVTKHKIRTNTKGVYFVKSGRRYYLHEFMRV